MPYRFAYFPSDRVSTVFRVYSAATDNSITSVFWSGMDFTIVYDERLFVYVLFVLFTAGRRFHVDGAPCYYIIRGRSASLFAAGALCRRFDRQTRAWVHASFCHIMFATGAVRRRTFGLRRSSEREAALPELPPRYSKISRNGIITFFPKEM